MTANEIDRMFQDAPAKAVNDDEPPANVRRDRWGRPLITPPGGGEPKAYMRASTVAGSLDDKTALGDWKARMAGRGVAMSPDLIAGFASLPDLDQPDNKKTAKELVEQAMERAGSSHKRTLGTALHTFTERYDRGERGFYVPEELHKVFGEYIRMTAGIQWLAIEAFGVHDELGMAGTTDRVGIRADWAKPRVMDLKTGRVDFGQMKFAVQLYIYAAMHRYDPETGRRAPWPDMDMEVGHIIHADPATGKVEIHDVDLVKGRKAAELALQVYHLRKDKDIMAMRTPFPAPATANARPIQVSILQGNSHDQAAKAAGSKTILQKIFAATTLDELKALYQETGQMWNTRHQRAAELRTKDIKEGKTS